MPNDDKSDPPKDGFSERERITANLRFRSLPAAQRTLLGAFAFVPYPWRGPLAIVVVIAATVLALRFAPSLGAWFVKMVGGQQP